MVDGNWMDGVIFFLQRSPQLEPLDGRNVFMVNGFF